MIPVWYFMLRSPNFVFPLEMTQALFAPCLLPVPWCIFEPELPAGKQPGLGKGHLGEEEEKQQLEVVTSAPPVPSALHMIVAASTFHVTSLIVGI